MICRPFFYIKSFENVSDYTGNRLQAESWQTGGLGTMKMRDRVQNESSETMRPVKETTGIQRGG